MLKIVLHCDIPSRKQFEPELTEYLSERNIPFEIYHIGNASKFLSDYFFHKDYQLLLICKEKQLKYIMKTYYNFDKNYMHLVSGILELPLTSNTLNNELFDNIENTYRCPYGVYIVNNRTILQKILHEEIEYIHRVNDKSLIHLINKETKETKKSIVAIKKEINEKYFVQCCKGYLVNIFNIKKANKDTHTIELISGAKIPLTKRSFQEFVKTYISSMHGFKLWSN